MQDAKTKKSETRKKILALRDSLPEKDRQKKSIAILERLFDFANFAEAKIVLFYMSTKNEVATAAMIKTAMEHGKVIALPKVDPSKKQLVPYKVEDLEKDICPGFKGIQEPNPQTCKLVPLDYINLAIIPGIGFDERGGRIGYGTGFYDRLMPNLDSTTRRVALAFECQIVPHIPMESHDRYIDIIITENRIIYKI